MAFPFKLGKNAFSVSWKKISGGVEATNAGGNYSEDVYQLAQTYGQRQYFFAAAPIYDLISWGLADNVHDKTKGLKQKDSLQSEFYNSEYDITFNRPLYADKRDFFVPSNVSFAVARDIRAAETLSDTNQYKLKLGWAAFNIFGKYGSIPIASWFEQDEYLASFTATLKVPRAEPSDITQVYTTYLQANFYITKDNVLKNGAEFSFQDLNNYTIKGTIAWKRPGKTSAISALAKLIFKRLREQEIPIVRSDSINCSWRSASSVNSKVVKQTHSYEYIHSAEFQFAKFFALTTEIDLGFTCAFDDICTLTATWSLGGKLNF
jgi:DNA polymerase-4